MAGCAGGSSSPVATRRAGRSALETYLHEVEPIRLSVNQLLTGADPILSAYRDGRISPVEAARRMGALEQKFAAYSVDIAAIAPSEPALRALHAAYAHTYVLEDAYLSALAAGLADRQLGELPNTQAAQRAAIIHWRIGLAVLARAAGIGLPPDLQRAGRGEIAPSPSPAAS